MRQYRRSRAIPGPEEDRPDVLRAEPVQWAQANIWAQQFCSLIRSHCDRYSVCGSVRRMRQRVRDIEVLAIPTYRAAVGVIPDVLDRESRLEDVIRENVDRFRMLKNGPKYKQMWMLDDDGFALIKVDLFITMNDQWGYLQTIRTGPAEFSRLCVTHAKRGGWLRDDLSVLDGVVLRRSGEVLAVPSEQEFFERCLTIDYVAPHLRDECVDGLRGGR